MAAKLVQRPIPSSQVVPQIPSVTKMMRVQRPFSATHPKIARFGEHSSGFKPIKVAEQSGIEVQGEDQPPELRTPTQVKARLYEAVQGINRGIFGVQSAKKSEIEGLVKLLESQNPITEPSVFLKKVGGRWRLVYSTITILGSKRTKLGLRDFIALGDFYQTIDTAERKAVNVIEFNARGLNFLNGQLKIEASFQIASKSRVDINYTNSTISPDQLMNLFQKNYDLLLSIFNPEGWLDTTYPFTDHCFQCSTHLELVLHAFNSQMIDNVAPVPSSPRHCRYVDDTLRIGRDDRGNVFILERSEENQA